MKSVLKYREIILKNSKVVSFLSPFKVGQAGNLWTLPRICVVIYHEHKIASFASVLILIFF